MFTRENWKLKLKFRVLISKKMTRVYRSVMKLTCEHEDFTISKVIT